MITQISYHNSRGTHMFMGADRWSNGVYVGKASLLEAYDEVTAQLERLLADNHELEGKAFCTIKREDIEEALKPLNKAMLSWQLDTWQ